VSKLNVQSIFDSIDGEANGFDGAGQLTTFIRLKGCNLRCSYCDTEYSQESAPYNWMTIDEVIEQVHFNKVTITGGEPLLQQKAVKELCSNLQPLLPPANHHDISIETNGTIQVRYRWSGVRYIVDYKLPSSGCEKDMNPDAFDFLYTTDVIKFVIADDKDYSRAVHLINENPQWKAKKVFSPAISIKSDPFILQHPMPEVDICWPARLAERMIRERVNANFSLQLHKILWPGAKEER